MTRLFVTLFVVLWASFAQAQVQPYAKLNRAVTGSIVGQAAALAEFPNFAVVTGRSYIITTIVVQTTTATSGTYAIQSGTGTNCGTSTTAVFPSASTAARFNAPITSQAAANIYLEPPLVVTPGHAVCLIGTATNTISAQIIGYASP